MTSTFYQIWDVRGEMPRVLDTTETRELVRNSRRQLLRKNRQLSNSDVKLVQVTFGDSAGLVKFIR